MIKTVLISILLPILLLAEQSYHSYVIPAFSTVNTGVERMWSWSGISGGFIINRHRIGGELYYQNRDEVIPGVTLQNNLHLWGTAYVHWEFEFSFRDFFRIAPGISLGYQYAEVDRNWDSTYVGEYLLEPGDTHYGTIPLNWEAESKVQSFGGPQVSIAAGWKRVFVHSRFRCNAGYFKKWGGFKNNDPEVTAVYCEEELSVGTVTVSESGWQNRSTGVLETGWMVLPEWQFGVMIIF